MAGKIMGTPLWLDGDGSPIDKMLRDTRLSGMSISEAMDTMANAVRRCAAFLAMLDNEPGTAEYEKAERIINAGTPLSSIAAPVVKVSARTGHAASALAAAARTLHTMPVRPPTPAMGDPMYYVLPTSGEVGGDPVAAAPWDFIARDRVTETIPVGQFWQFTIAGGARPPTRILLDAPDWRVDLIDVDPGVGVRTVRLQRVRVTPSHVLVARTKAAIQGARDLAGEAARAETPAEKQERERREGIEALRRVAEEAKASGVEA